MENSRLTPGGEVAADPAPGLVTMVNPGAGAGDASAIGYWTACSPKDIFRLAGWIRRARGLYLRKIIVVNYQIFLLKSLSS